MSDDSKENIERFICEVEASAGDIIAIKADLELSTVIADLNATGFRATLIDRAPVFNQETLFHALYQSLNLPAYFGFNWDALKDCLTELEQAEDGKGHVLAFNDLTLLKDDLKILVEVIADVNRVLADHDEPAVRIVAAKA